MAISDYLPNFLSSNYGVIGGIFGVIIVAYILFRAFKSFGGESRVTEEEQELGIENEEEKLTKKRISMERSEKKIIKNIIEMLLDIRRNLKSTSQIKVGKEEIYVEQAVIVLANSLQKLINTGDSIRKEETTLNNMRAYWSITRQGLLSISAIRMDVVEINSLFEELGIELRLEEEVSEQMIRLVREEYQLVVQEEGVNTVAA